MSVSDRNYLVLILILLLAGCGTPEDVHRHTPIAYHSKCFEVKIPHEGSMMSQNLYLLYDENSKYAVIIDPGTRSAEMEDFVDANQLVVKAILNTHGHFDHIGANGFYRVKYSCAVYGNKNDRFFYKDELPENEPDEYFSKDTWLQFGNIKIEVICTPGHSLGGTCFLSENILYSGDSLFKHAIGRTWTYAGKTEEEYKQLLTESIKKKLFILPEDIIIYPGHGEATTLMEEKYHNPFF